MKDYIKKCEICGITFETNYAKKIICGKKECLHERKKINARKARKARIARIARIKAAALLDKQNSKNSSRREDNASNTKKCVVCKKKFVPKIPRQILCGDKDCARERVQQLKEKNEPKSRLKKTISKAYVIDDRKKQKNRKCLKCGEDFLSFGASNRICPTCKKLKIYSSDLVNECKVIIC